MLLRSAGEKINRLRLADIDAPELDQPWGKEAGMALMAWVESRAISVEVLDIDRYGRWNATGWVDSENINQRLVAEGYAWTYRKYLRDRIILDLEDIARSKKRGLWSSDAPTEPWIWRRKQ